MRDERVQRGLTREAEEVSGSPLFQSLLECVEDYALVLDERLELVTSNTAFAKFAHAEPQELIGVRPGDAIGCESAIPTGCGCSKMCLTCGIQRVARAAQAAGGYFEDEVLLTVMRDGEPVALELHARAKSVSVARNCCVLVTLRDISDHKRREAFERIFFHDILNLIASASGWSRLLERGEIVAPEKAVGRIQTVCRKLEQEVRYQQRLTLAERKELFVTSTEVDVQSVFACVEDTCGSLSDVPLVLPDSVAPGTTLVTDKALLSRILVNMVKNAIEASRPPQEVCVEFSNDETTCCFSVLNAAAIPPEVAGRIFQRSFSTKGPGRGLGTYSMKLFGERYLGGKVGFTTGAQGTRFSIELPLEGPATSSGDDSRVQG